jgi:predicted regulator of Ras-like GTPase activity (Roadblock/LC7/MglB family)
MSALANNFKKNFAGLLRGLLRKVDNSDFADPQAEHHPLQNQPMGGPGPQPDSTAAIVSDLHSVPGDPRLQAVSEPGQYTATPARGASLSELEMPLMPILERLPADLRSKWMLGGVDLQQAMISVPVKKVLPQLALGAVKITFGELRTAAPSLFRTGEEYDSLSISLPLNEVLARLNPALIPRNPSQRTVAPPVDIAEPFGPGVQGAAFVAAAPAVKPAPPTTHFYKKPVPSPGPIRMPTPPAVAGQPLPSLPFAPRATTPAPKPPAPAIPPAPAQPLPFAPRATTPASPTSPPAPNPRVNFNGGAFHQTPPLPTRNSVPNSIPNTFSKIPMSKPPAQAPAPAPVPRPAAMPAPVPVPRPAAVPMPVPAAEAPSLLAPLAALCEDWPESLRQEIAQMNLTNAQVALPIHLIEPALRRGRVIISWHHVRTWLKPTPAGPSGHDTMDLELPLKVIAPLFLPAKKAEVKPQARAEVPPTSVPNLFFGFPQPQPEEMAPPINMPEAVPLVKPLDVKLNDSNFYVWGEGGEDPHLDESEFKRAAAPSTDFSSRRAMPNEIIARAMKLPGVTGAIIALGDGLKVAQQLPAELNADTVAAFLPQLFSRVSQCAKELRMGELNNLNFTLGNVPWKIFRVNAVYFAAFGVAGVSLPTAQLAMLAGELDRKK